MGDLPRPAIPATLIFKSDDGWTIVANKWSAGAKGAGLVQINYRWGGGWASGCIKATMDQFCFELISRTHSGICDLREAFK